MNNFLLLFSLSFSLSFVSPLLTFLSSGNVRLFPINREENYEDDEDEYVSDQTRILCYVLGAFYCFTGTLSFFGLVCFVLFCFLFAFCFFAYVSFSCFSSFKLSEVTIRL